MQRFHEQTVRPSEQTEEAISSPWEMLLLHMRLNYFDIF